MSTMINIYYDNTQNSIAIEFSIPPLTNIREGLKKCGFKYNWNNNIWIATAKKENKNFVKFTIIPLYNRKNVKIFVKGKEKLYDNSLAKSKDLSKASKNNPNDILYESKNSKVHNIMTNKERGYNKISKNISSSNIDKVNLLQQNNQTNIDNYKIGTIVMHQSFGKGKVINNVKKLIEVKFEDDTILKFNLDTCLDENIIEIIDDKWNLDNLECKELEELIELSNEMYSKGESGNKSLKINKIIINKGCNDIKYYFRLAECYEKQDMVEEAIDLYNTILKIDKNNKDAQDYLSLYGKSIYYKYRDKPFDGVYRDVHSPPSEEITKWFEEEQEKNNIKFLNSLNE